MVIKNFKDFEGQHCETTATGSLLKQIGIDLSEAMIFGLGEGLGYIFWKMKSMDFPFIGGRIKTDVLTQNICRNLNLHLVINETASVKKAWKNVEDQIHKGKAVGVKLDCYHLEYFTKKIHFAGHYAAMYGYDDTDVYLIDTAQQGGRVKTSLKSFELARNEKGPMSSKNLTYTIHKRNKDFDKAQAIKNAIINNAQDYLNPPIQNFGFKGILKTSQAIKNWFENTVDIKGDFQTTAMLMEKAGTGGSLFRNLYRDFLKEGADVLESKEVEKCYLEFAKIAKLWKEIANLFHQAGETRNIEYINKASEILVLLSEKEKSAMEKLKTCIEDR